MALAGCVCAPQRIHQSEVYSFPVVKVMVKSIRWLGTVLGEWMLFLWSELVPKRTSSYDKVSLEPESFWLPFSPQDLFQKGSFHCNAPYQQGPCGPRWWNSPILGFQFQKHEINKLLSPTTQFQALSYYRVIQLFLLSLSLPFTLFSSVISYIMETPRRAHTTSPTNTTLIRLTL